jgi:hypothetical protein
VSEETRVILIFVLVVILMLTVAFYGSTMLMKKAVKDVIKNFRKKNALSETTAVEPIDLGFKRKSLFHFGTLRDYKPSALQLLQRQNIVNTTEDGKLYLLEDALMQSGLEEKVRKIF